MSHSQRLKGKNRGSVSCWKRMGSAMFEVFQTAIYCGQRMETKSLNTFLAEALHTPFQLGCVTKEILLFLES